jgi:hypothetical protein
MSYNEAYQNYTDIDGNIQYSNPIFYLLNYQNGIEIANSIPTILNNVVKTQETIDAVIKDKYTKVKSNTPQGGQIHPKYWKDNIGAPNYKLGMPDPGRKFMSSSPASLKTFKMPF